MHLGVPRTGPSKAGCPRRVPHSALPPTNTRQVNYAFGSATHELLKKLGAPAEFLTVRGMGHSAAPGELAAVADFLKRVLP